MNAAGYDYITLGNHDFNYGLTYLNKYLHTLKAKCLCANIVDKTGQLPILPYDIKTLGNGLRVGIIGITTDFINRWERDENIENLTISTTYKAVSYYFDEVKSSCNVLIGIYHGGFEYDLETHKQLTKTSENIAYKLCEDFSFDILLTGHQHMSIAGQTLHGTHIAQTPFNGTKYLELDLTLQNDGIKTIESSLKDVSINPQKEMYEKYLPLEEKFKNGLIHQLAS